MGKWVWLALMILVVIDLDVFLLATTDFRLSLSVGAMQVICFALLIYKEFNVDDSLRSVITTI